MIRVFISHSSKDLEFVTLLTELLMDALPLEKREIRCTSVPGFRLNVGARTSSTLRQELNECAAVIGVLTKESLTSSYVLFELGAAWGLDKPVFPVLGPGANHSDVQGPLSERHIIHHGNDTDWWGLVDELAQTLEVSQKPARDFAHRVRRLAAYPAASSERPGRPINPDASPNPEAPTVPAPAAHPAHALAPGNRPADSEPYGLRLTGTVIVGEHLTAIREQLTGVGTRISAIVSGEVCATALVDAAGRYALEIPPVGARGGGGGAPGQEVILAVGENLVEQTTVWEAGVTRELDLIVTGAGPGGFWGMLILGTIQDHDLIGVPAGSAPGAVSAVIGTATIGRADLGPNRRFDLRAQLPPDWIGHDVVGAAVGFRVWAKDARETVPWRPGTFAQVNLTAGSPPPARG